MKLFETALFYGTNTQKVRERLINEGADLTLDKAIQIAQGYHTHKNKLRSMNVQDVHAVHNRNRFLDQNKRHQPERRAPPTTTTSKPETTSRDSRNPCRNCGYKHTPSETCRAKGKQCTYCKKWHHFASVCRQENNDESSRKSVSCY